MSLKQQIRANHVTILKLNQKINSLQPQFYCCEFYLEWNTKTIAIKLN